MLAPNRSPERHCLVGSLAHVQQHQIEKIRYPQQLCFGDAFSHVHLHSVAPQHAGAQVLHLFVAIDDEHVFRGQLKGNRRLLGHSTPPSFMGGRFGKQVTFVKPTVARSKHCATAARKNLNDPSLLVHSLTETPKPDGECRSHLTSSPLSVALSRPPLLAVQEAALLDMA